MKAATALKLKKVTVVAKDKGIFEINALKEPPAHFWPGYWLVLNDRMDWKKLRRQLRDMRKHEARSLCLLPMPREYNPKKFGAVMAPAYLSRSFFKMIRRIVAECRRLGMNFWLYDEGGWPSPSAAGQVYARNPPAYTPQGIAFCETPFSADETYTVPATVLCAAIRARAGWRVFLPGQTIKGLARDTAMRTFYVESSAQTPATPYINLLCREAVDKFIELTHERYKKYVGDSFGKTIRFAFLDEPAMWTWTSDLREVFKRMKGYDLVLRLPELFDRAQEGKSPEHARLRIDFNDVLSRLYIERYLIPMRNWCRANGLMSGGHFNGEDKPVKNDGCGFGHILRSLRALDLPGVDAISRELFPGVRSHHYPKYASSAARQMGQPYVLTESFAVYGSGLTLAEMKWVIDQQYVRGVSLAVLSNYPYSTRDQFMLWCRPHFGRFHPLWRYFAPFQAYTARLGYLLSRGQPACQTAVYFDVRGIWAGGQAKRNAVERHDRLADVLLKHQCDFDFIDDDLLAGQGSRIEDGCLVIGPMHYKTIIVPTTDWMEEKAIAGLAKFVRQGGRLIMADGPVGAEGGKITLPADLPVRRPDHPGAGGCVFRTTIDRAATFIKPVVRLTPSSEDIRVCKRSGPGFAFYFLTNEADRPIRVRGLFAETAAPCLCDLPTGEMYRLEATTGAEGTELALEFPPWGSKAILFGIQAGKLWREFKTVHSMPLKKGWTIRPLKQYSVGARNYEIHNLYAARRSCRLGDWRKSLGEWFSGDAEYSVEFECSAVQAGQPARLDLGEVRYACEMKVNGRSAGQRAWMPFEVNISGLLRQGKNTLKVTVTNTFANALHDPEVVECWKKKKGPGWMGYDEYTRKFEPDSFPSGLFGPARILFGG